MLRLQMRCYGLTRDLLFVASELQMPGLGHACLFCSERAALLFQFKWDMN